MKPELESRCDVAYQIEHTTSSSKDLLVLGVVMYPGTEVDVERTSMDEHCRW